MKDFGFDSGDVIQVGRKRFVVSFPYPFIFPDQKVDENIYLYERRNWMAGGKDGPDATLEWGRYRNVGYVNSRKRHIRPFWGKVKRIGWVGRIWPEEKT